KPCWETDNEQAQRMVVLKGGSP
ncbi:hypothetical protein LCGC14_3061420, partial [marine sediment metagenome]